MFLSGYIYFKKWKKYLASDLNMKNTGDMKWTKVHLWFMKIEIKVGENSSNLFIGEKLESEFVLVCF